MNRLDLRPARTRKMGVPDDHLLTIGAFARRRGLTASASRFYDDAGLLAPATVDAASGYRFYAPERADRATVSRACASRRQK